MSDILIKGMKMPSDCDSCFIPGSFCHLWINTDVGSRHADCPLISVPPHGDLIDRDALRSSIKESIDECWKWADEVEKDTMMYARISQSVGTFVECSLRAKAAPVIIPAEEAQDG